MSTPLLAAYGIEFAYFSEEFVLREVSFELARGEILALIGPNGGGKSTLLKLLGGVMDPNPGRIHQIKLQGRMAWDIPVHERAQTVAYLGSELHDEFPLTVAEVVELGARVGGGTRSTIAERVERALERCGCQELRNQWIHELSGGERQRVILARGIAQGARVLLLDETFSKMDLHHQARLGALVRELTREGGQAAIWVSHDINLLSEWADRALLLKNGTPLALGSWNEVATENGLRRLYPDSRVKVVRVDGSDRAKVFLASR